MTTAEIIQIIIGILSLLATILVSFLIYWRQKCHEKELEQRNKTAQKNAIADAAKIFIIDNYEDIDYLPLCVIAASVKKYNKHCRKIYREFNNCSAELQSEILKQENIPIVVTENSDWVDIVISLFIKDAKKYQLGRNILYDGAKYFHRAFDRYADNSVESYNLFQFKIPIMNKVLAALSDGNEADLTLYIDRYLEFVLKDMEDTKDKPELLPQEPPFDMVWRTQNMGMCDEEDVCFWVMQLICSSCIALFRHNLVKNGNEEWRKVNIGDAKVETFEDKYYETLLILYEVYANLYTPKNITSY